MGLALVVIKEHPGGTVQLGDDDALRAVDHKGAVVCHERNLAHVDFLLLDVLDGLVGAFLIVDDQAHLDAQGAGIGHAAQLALAHVKDGGAQLVIDIFQRCIPAVADDREHGLEGRVQAIVLALFQGYALLRELAIGIELNRQQIGHIHDLRHRSEVLADAFFLSVRVRHLYSPVLVDRRRQPFEIDIPFAPEWCPV